MKKAVIILLLSVFTFALFAKTNVAVTTFEISGKAVTEDEADIITELFITELAGQEEVNVVDRNNFNKILDEMKFQASDWSNKDKTAKLGSAINASMIVRGTIMKLGSIMCLTSTVIDVNTAEIKSSSKVEFSSLDEIFGILNSFAKEVSSKLALVKIGDIGPGGGIVFYIEGDTGFECSEVMGSYRLEELQKTTNVTINSKNDWYLPTIDELKLIYDNLVKRNIIAGGSHYLSKTKYYLIDFSYGGLIREPESKSGNVRYVRKFKISDLGKNISKSNLNNESKIVESKSVNTREETVTKSTLPKISVKMSSATKKLFADFISNEPKKYLSDVVPRNKINYKLGETGPGGGIIVKVDNLKGYYWEWLNLNKTVNWYEACELAKSEINGYRDWSLPYKREYDDIQWAFSKEFFEKYYKSLSLEDPFADERYFWTMDEAEKDKDTYAVIINLAAPFNDGCYGNRVSGKCSLGLIRRVGDWKYEKGDIGPCGGIVFSVSKDDNKTHIDEVFDIGISVTWDDFINNYEKYAINQYIWYRSSPYDKELYKLANQLKLPEYWLEPESPRENGKTDFWNSEDGRIYYWQNTNINDKKGILYVLRTWVVE